MQGPQGRSRGGLQRAGQGLCAKVPNNCKVECTVVEGFGGLRTTVGRSRALPHPMGARRTESEAGEGARGARRASAVAFRGFNWMLTKVVHKIDALKLDKITPKLHVKPSE